MPQADNPQDKHPGGRPLKFETVEDLQQAIEEYFDYCDNRIQHVYSPKQEKVIEVIDPAPYTMSGLARHIGLSRQGLLDYANRDQFLDAIKAARERVHEDVESRLMEKNATGAIFNLKNNFGWKDKTEQDVNHSGEVSFVNDVPRPE
jgi:hypothetical protein